MLNLLSPMQQNYLDNIRKQCTYYKTLGERTFAQLSDADLIWQYNAESNSVAIIVHHLWGNMLSRFTDFLTTDGEKPWRQREHEFDDVIQTRADLLDKWEAGWACTFEAIDSISVSDMDQPVYIRQQAHTIVEALNRQLAHYAYHIGQIVYLGRMLKGSEWQSLSIPRGQSAAFNQAKMGKGKHGGHFTDDFVDSK